MWAAESSLAQQRQRMAPQREALGAVVRRDVLSFGGRREQRRAFGRLRHGRERQLLLAAGHLPESEMTVARQLAQRARIRQRFELAARKIRAQREVLHAREWRLRTRRHDAHGGLLAQAFHHAQTQPQRRLVIRRGRSSVQSQSLLQTLIGRTSTP